MTLKAGPSGYINRRILRRSLDVDRFLDATPNVESNHQLGELRPIDQDDSLAEQVCRLPRRGRER